MNFKWNSISDLYQITHLALSFLFIFNIINNAKKKKIQSILIVSIVNLKFLHYIHSTLMFDDFILKFSCQLHIITFFLLCRQWIWVNWEIEFHFSEQRMFENFSIKLQKIPLITLVGKYLSKKLRISFCIISFGLVIKQK